MQAASAMPADLRVSAFILVSRVRKSLIPNRRVREGARMLEMERKIGRAGAGRGVKLLGKFQPASRGETDTRRGDVDYRLLVPLLFNVAIIQAVYAIVRVTTSYRAIELKLPVVWLGIISATFAILPIIFAVQVGRYLDRGKDAQAAWIGASLLVVACAGFRFAAGSLMTLLLLTALLGFSHILIMASQQMLCVPLHRTARPRCRFRQLCYRQRGRAGARPLSGRVGRWVGDFAADRPPVHDRTDGVFCVAGDSRRHPAGAGAFDRRRRARRSCRCALCYVSAG